MTDTNPVRGAAVMLAPAQPGPIEDFDHVDALARRLHQLRTGAGLTCTPAVASIDGSALFSGVCVWRARRGEPPAYLAFAAGPGADRPAALLDALGRTRLNAPGNALKQ